ncbi:MAG: TylF/MycF/NovP-related O-methyltransferase [Alloacidobacterium sp.]
MGLTNRDSISIQELQSRDSLLKLLKHCPIPEDELIRNLGLFIKRQDISAIIFKNELYKQILSVPGIVIEFGVRWGQSLALFESFRGMYEPYNHYRKIVGFDTFSGFPGIHEKDGRSEVATPGGYSVTDRYEEYLNEILQCHEQQSPISHIKKFELVKGDARVSIDKYLSEHPETIVALAYFDFDLYEPTRKCLEAIVPHLTKGSVIGFDELNNKDFPGETIALKEVLGLSKYRLQRCSYMSIPSFLVVE